MRFAGALIICFSLSQIPLMTASDEGEIADVTILVSTTFGEPVPDAAVELTSVGPKKSFVGKGGTAKFKGIPFGWYDVQVQTPGFLARRERIRVYETAISLHIGLELAPTHAYKRPVLSGTISIPGRNRSNMWVRLVGLYGSDLIENSVAETGAFQLVGMGPGRYLLIVLQDGNVLTTKPIEILERKQTVEIAR